MTATKTTKKKATAKGGAFTSSSQIVNTLNSAWRDIQRRNPEVPNVMIVTGRRRHKSEGNVLGQHCRDTWHSDGAEEKVAEVWIAGESLVRGGSGVLTTLIHEATHALARVRDIRDTSNKNRYHNKAFVRLAEELGLEAPASSGGPALGYSMCTMKDDTADLYKSTIDSLDEMCRNFVPVVLADAPKPKRETIKAYCECEDAEDFAVTWSKKLATRFEESGFYPLVCNICKQVFVPEGEDRP